MFELFSSPPTKPIGILRRVILTAPESLEGKLRMRNIEEESEHSHG